MSFWSKLFGGGAPKAAEAGPTREVEHDGFTVRAEPYKSEGGQYQLAGTISKEVGGVRKEHRYVRADRFGSADDALEFSLAKGRQIVDQEGERILRAVEPGAPPQR